jgi:hypothetical protein
MNTPGDGGQLGSVLAGWRLVYHGIGAEAGMKHRSRWQVAGDFSLAGGAFLSVQQV